MKSRLDKIREIINEKNLDAILISSPSNLAYLISYPFEKEDREAFILITKTKQYIVVSPLIQPEVIKTAPHFIFVSPPFGKGIQDICKKENIKMLGVEADNLTLSEYKSIKSPETKLVPIVLQTLRDVKDVEEILAIEKACSIGDKAFEYILTQIKPGMSEKEIAFLLETFIRQQGADISFKTVVAFSKNAAIPHHITDDTKLAKHDSILLDFGVKYQNYCSDMSRTIFIEKPTKEEKRVYETVRIAQEKAIEYLRVSWLLVHGSLHEGNKRPTMNDELTNHELGKISAKLVDKVARDHIISQGYPEYLHSLGHSIGIDVHDGFRLSPTSKNNLVEHMVFSIEPGIYIPGKMGVRIEDIVILEKSGPRLLTKSSRDLTVL